MVSPSLRQRLWLLASWCVCMFVCVFACYQLTQAPLVCSGLFPTANWVDIKRFSRLKFNCEIDNFILCIINILYSRILYYCFYVLVIYCCMTQFRLFLFNNLMQIFRADTIQNFTSKRMLVATIVKTIKNNNNCYKNN